MANDSTTAGQVASEQDAAPINDGYFTDAQGEEAFFGPEQLAQAAAGGAPVQIPVPADQNVIRVQVNPGEILELSSPFDPGAGLLGREADGNLAIKVGDVTVILMGFVDANAAAPVVVETSDGQPIDIATLLASTDPTIDIQTAAGPAAGAQGQGADNTGAILALLQGGAGLGGLNAVGAQDQTQLSYGLIDNAIKLDRDDPLLLSAAGLSRFPGVAEPFLRDPFHTNTFLSFDDFKSEYTTYIDAHKADKGGWADFTGTEATTDDSATFLQDTSYIVTVSHSSTDPEQLNLLDGPDFFNGAVPKSNGETLVAEFLSASDHSTIVLVRPSDHAVVMVFHVQEPDSTGDFHVEVYLINRLDHQAQGQDVLTVGFHTEIFTPPLEGQESQGTTQDGPSGSVDILDDIPVTGQTDYYSFTHAESFKDAADCFSAFLGGKITDFVPSHDAGRVDEDYIFRGNRDKDNATGPDVDEDRGDNIGDKFVVGMLHIDFGADGPSGKIPEGDGPTKTDPVFHDANPQALEIADLKVGDPFPDAKSHGHDLVVLKHEKLPFPFSTVEMVQVGYHADAATPSGEGLAKTDVGYGDTVVFTLLLQTGPNLPLFGGFVFEQCAPLDHPLAATLESDLPLNFKVTATDDDGDHPVDPVTIHILVNDDAPTFQITYTNEDPHNHIERDVETFTVGGGDHYTTKDFGHVDEDWLNGGDGNGVILANGPGNHDQDGNGDDNANLYGDDKGGLEVCGQIKVKYGADGPSDGAHNGELALKTYGPIDPANQPQFVNGDGSHLTSDGKPLVVFISTEGHLQVGVAAFFVPGGGDEGEPFLIPGQIVFDLTLDPSTGKFDFHLMGAIDHVPATVGGQPESNLVLSFNVGSAEDFDHDTAIGAINIKVNDDKPEVGITYSNEIPTDYGEGIGISYKNDTDFGRIDEDWLKGATGNSESPSFVTIGNKDEDYYGDGNANQFGDDYGTDHLSGQINVKYGADGPGSQKIGLEILSGAFKDAGQNALFSGGNALTVLSSSATSLVIGYGSTHVLELTLNSSGHFDFKQLMPLDHPIHSTIEDNINLAFNAGSITDGDGDTVNAVIKIQVNDDVPETGITYTTGDEPHEGFVGIEALPPAYGQVDEDYLAHGNLDADNGNPGDESDPVRGDTDGRLIVDGTFDGTKYGADGPDGSPGKTFVLTELTAGDAFNDADGNPLKSHGNPLVVLGSDGQTLEVGYHNGTDPDTVVFTLKMDGPNGFEFELKEPLDDTPKAGGKIEDGVVLVFGAENDGAPTDKDGDPAARIVIHVNDDAPRDCEVSYTSYSGPGDPDDNVVPDPYPPATAGVVDEAWAELTGLGNGYSDTRTGDEAGYSHATALVTVDFGADGPADGGGFAFDEYKVGDTFLDANNSSYSSGGETLVVQAASATEITVGIDGGAPIFIVSINPGGVVSFLLEGALDHPYGDEVETDLQVVLHVTATDFDGDSVDTHVTFKVNDDAPIAVNEQTDFQAPDPINGNIFDQAKKGADDGRISVVNGILIPDGGSHTFNGLDGSAMVIFANGSWSFTPGSDENGRPTDQTFTYTIIDGDGDTATANLILNYTGNDGVGSRLAFVASGPTHEAAPHYDHDVTVTGLNGIANPFDSKTYHFEDPTGGHIISGGAGNDYIHVTGSTGAVLSGNGGDDIIHGGDGASILKGGAGDDTLFGGAGADSFFGDAGHDAMSGGGGDDTFYKVDADDLDGTNTLDGTHSIDGGMGTDTVDLSVLKTFDSSQALHLENVEHLAFEGKASGGGGTAVTLDYNAAYGITEIGGLHQLSITGDKNDTLHLVSNGANTWHLTGTPNEYEASRFGRGQGDGGYRRHGPGLVGWNGDTIV
jgi:T1SS-143 domain-containing protein